MCSPSAGQSFPRNHERADCTLWDCGAPQNWCRRHNDPRRSDDEQSRVVKTKSGQRLESGHQHSSDSSEVRAKRGPRCRRLLASVRWGHTCWVHPFCSGSVLDCAGQSRPDGTQRPLPVSQDCRIGVDCARGQFGQGHECDAGRLKRLDCQAELRARAEKRLGSKEMSKRQNGRTCLDPGVRVDLSRWNAMRCCRALQSWDERCQGT